MSHNHYPYSDGIGCPICQADHIEKLEQECAALRALTAALGSAVQPFIKSVPADKWKAVTDAYAAIPEPLRPKPHA